MNLYLWLHAHDFYKELRQKCKLFNNNNTNEKIDFHEILNMNQLDPKTLAATASLVDTNFAIFRELALSKLLRNFAKLISTLMFGGITEK